MRPVEATVGRHGRRRAGPLAAGAAPADVAVLTRVNATLAPVQVALGLAGVPADRVAGPTWLQRTGVRSALAWLRLADGDFDPGDLAEAARRPPRGLSRQGHRVDRRAALGRRRASAWPDGSSRDRDREKVEAFADDLRAVAAEARERQRPPRCWSTCGTGSGSRGPCSPWTAAGAGSTGRATPTTSTP